MTPSSRRVEDPLQHIKDRVHITDSGCWEWQRHRSQAGYGRVGLADFSTDYVHIIAYTLVVGPVPDGLELDHLCRNRACCNPDHLEPVTHRENVQRGTAGEAARALSALQTHCVRGHEYTPENTRIRKSGRRQCRTCARKQAREAARARRAATPPKPRKRATHCKAGHEFTAENTAIRPNGDRRCKECNRQAARKHRQKVSA